MGVRAVVIGLDGLEPSLVEEMLAQGRLPHLDRLRRRGGYARLATTLPAQTPVAWSSFAVGANPGVHGIFDFLHRDPATYRPHVSLFRVEQAGRFLPPRAVNGREGRTLWSLLGEAGVPSTVLRHPATYPPEPFRGRLLSGVGVPDVRGGFGTSTWYTAAEADAGSEAEHVVRVTPASDGDTVLPLRGPTLSGGGDAVTELTLSFAQDGEARLRSGEGSVSARPGGWSDWLPVRFKLGLLQTVRGMVRFHLTGREPFGLHASPVHFDPDIPVFPISHPWDYAGELKRTLGPFHTLGMAEEHGPLNGGRIDEEAYLAQCHQVFEERRRMMLQELERFREGFFYCLFDTPDRIQHMFWRFRDPTHPSHGGAPFAPALARVIGEHYERCDAVVGEVLDAVGDDAIVLVASDHGFTDFRRALHLNAWLHREGYLALRPGVEPGADAGDLLQGVDWARTRAYALGLGGLYLNLRGREAEGIVDPRDAPGLSGEVARRLGGLSDDGGARPVNRVVSRDEAYRGPHVNRAPDLLVCCAPGYRIASASAMGGVAGGIFEDNRERWSGDHVVDPLAVPGVLFSSRPIHAGVPDIRDLAPSVMKALGVPRGEAMEGMEILP